MHCAYWLGGDPLFQSIGHSASTLTIRMQIEGPGIQPLKDESWAIDNLTIRALQLSRPRLDLRLRSVVRAGAIGVRRAADRHDAQHVVSNLPSNTLLTGLAFGLSDGAPLPRALDVLGAPGFYAHHDAAVSAAFFLQAWAFAPGVNPLGLLNSDGLRVQVGQ